MNDMPRIKQNVIFDPDNYAHVRAVQKERRLGGKGFSTALNLIIQEHSGECSHPNDQLFQLGKTTIVYPESQETIPIEIWKCRKCGRSLVLPVGWLEIESPANEQKVPA